MATITDHYGIALAVDRGSKAHFQTKRIFPAEKIDNFLKKKKKKMLIVILKDYTRNTWNCFRF